MSRSPDVPPYAGRAVLLTGASQGIGRALALELALQRPRLALAARDAPRLEEVASECRARGAEAVVVPTDVTVPDECRGAVAQTVGAFGALDVLVNNAGMSMWARLDELADLEVHERLMRVNYFGSVYPTFFALPHLKASRGQIVVIASVAGLTGVPTRTGYSASKHAVFGFFDSLRIELHPSGVSVTVVAPDFVLSEIHRRSLGPDGRPLGKSPMQESRLMTAEECARLTVRAMERRQRLAILSARGRLGRWAKLVAPGLVDGLAARAVRQGR